MSICAKLAACGEPSASVNGAADAHELCLYEARRLGFGDRGALRVGLAPYSDDGDVDRLLTGLGEFLAA